MLGTPCIVGNFLVRLFKKIPSVPWAVFSCVFSEYFNLLWCTVQWSNEKQQFHTIRKASNSKRRIVETVTKSIFLTLKLTWQLGTGISIKIAGFSPPPHLTPPPKPPFWVKYTCQCNLSLFTCNWQTTFQLGIDIFKKTLLKDKMRWFLEDGYVAQNLNRVFFFHRIW